MTSFQQRRRGTTTQAPVETQLQHLLEDGQAVDHMQVAVGRLTAEGRQVEGRQVDRQAAGDTQVAGGKQAVEVAGSQQIPEQEIGSCTRILARPCTAV